MLIHDLKRQVLAMKISLHSVSYAGFFYRGDPISAKDILVKLSTYGYDGVELMAKRPHADPMDLDEKGRRELRELADSQGVELANIAAYNDFSGPDTFKRELNLLYVHEVLKLAEDLDVPTVRVFAAGMRDTDETVSYWKQWELCREGLSEAAKWAEDFGVTLALQNHSPMIESFRDTIAMIEEIGSDSLKACIDPELLLWSGDLVPDSENLEKRLLDIYGAFKESIAFIHVGDSVIRPGKILWQAGGGGSRLRSERIERVVLGEGLFGKIAEPFIRTLKRINYDGFLSFEICSPRYVGHRLIDLEMLESEVVNGVRYLRGLISKA